MRDAESTRVIHDWYSTQSQQAGLSQRAGPGQITKSKKRNARPKLETASCFHFHPFTLTSTFLSLPSLRKASHLTSERFTSGTIQPMSASPFNSGTENINPIDDDQPSRQAAFLSAKRMRALSDLSTELSLKRQMFSFPSQLGFQPKATISSPKLSFDSINAPVLAYDDYLVGLLTRLDSIQSEGDEIVRRTRKEIVRSVEAELEMLDQKKAEAWQKQSTTQAPTSLGIQRESNGTSKSVFQNQVTTAHRRFAIV